MKLGFIAVSFAGFILGILAAPLFNWNEYEAWLTIFFSIIFFLRQKFFETSFEGQEFYLYISLALLFFSLALFRYSFVDTSKEIPAADYGPATSEGIIESEPSIKNNNVSFNVLLPKLRVNAQVTSRDVLSKFSYGDLVKISGNLKRVKNFDDNFNYAAYMAKDEIYYEFLNPKIIFISSGHASLLQEKLLEIKNSFLVNIDKTIPEPEAALMGGITIGAKNSLGKDILDEWRKVGLIQIVVLSGYNISVVADFIAQVLFFLPQIFQIGLGSVVVVLFSLMTGGGATVIRAAFMALIALLARATGRIYLSGSALLISGLFIVLYNPKVLLFDLSFQLSFIATAGLIFLSPVVEKYLEKIPDKFGLKKILIPTIAAQLAVFPLIAYTMGMVSLVAIPANVLVSPLVPYTMFLGFATGLAGYINQVISLPFAYLSYLFLAYDLKVADFLASLPFASLNISFPFWLMLSVYVFYIHLVQKNYFDKLSKG